MSAPTPTDHFGFFPFPNVAASIEPDSSLVHVGSLFLQKLVPYEDIKLGVMLQVEPDLVRFARYTFPGSRKRDVLIDWSKKEPSWNLRANSGDRRSYVVGPTATKINLYACLNWVLQNGDGICMDQQPSLLDGSDVQFESKSHELCFDQYRDMSVQDALSAPLKYFCWNKNDYVVVSMYWDVNSDKRIPESPYCTFLAEVFGSFYKSSCEQMLEQELPDPDIETPTTVDDNFGLSLRDYQQKTLTWMLNLENEKPKIYIGKTVATSDGSKLFNLETGEVCSTENIGENYYAIITGGILADDPGVGKTVTMLALHHATREKGTTMVICPANLISQWKSETQRCLGQSVHIEEVTTYADLRALRNEDMASCNILLVSHAFLLNRNFLTKFRNCAFNIFQFPFHRIIIDEIHELADKLENKRMKQYLTTISKFNAAHKWGMSGTPDLHVGNRVKSIASYLGVDIPETCRHFNHYIDLCVRRSKPRLELPHLETEIIPVTLGPEERAIYQTIQNDDLQALMLCSHFSMSDYNDVLTQSQRNEMEDGTITVQEVTRQIQASRQGKFDDLTNKINQKQSAIEASTHRIQEINDLMIELEENADDEDEAEEKIEKLKKEQMQLKKDIGQYRTAITLFTQEKNQLERELLYFDTSLNLVKNRSDYECTVCLEQFENDQTVSLTRCGHAFCQPCFTKLLQTNFDNASCPICRHPIQRNKVFLVRPYEPDTEGVDNMDDETPVDGNKFGTKLSVMAARILSILKKDPNSRFIIFAQFRRLTKLVAQALEQLKVSNVFVHGTVHTRDKAIRAFKEGRVQVVLLSAESSVSGLHLTEANHVILLHPFYYGPGMTEKAIASEKQGIARAHRFGQMRPVKVMRFVCRHTVESRLLDARQ